MSTRCYLGIDTSNYTTSLALADEQGRVIANLKQPLPVKEGERGLRQSDALFAHTKNLPLLMAQLQSLLHDAAHPLQLCGVGYSARPRSVEGSYMPCFLAGVSTAATVAAICNVPLIPLSHQDGHIMAAMYSAGATERLQNAPFFAFHVSGGTTEMLLVEPGEASFAVTLIGQSLDLHAGQAVDRIGVAMGLRFPCGPAMEEAAAAFEGKLPSPRVSVKGCDCHLSGLENMALDLYQKTQDRARTAAFTLDFIADSLLGMCRGAVEQYGAHPMLFAGGVMSNRRIQNRIAARYADACFAEPAFSADNAAGVALLCRQALTGR